jgi:hypothetical protein
MIIINHRSDSLCPYLVAIENLVEWKLTKKILLQNDWHTSELNLISSYSCAYIKSNIQICHVLIRIQPGYVENHMKSPRHSEVYDLTHHGNHILYIISTVRSIRTWVMHPWTYPRFQVSKPRPPFSPLPLKNMRTLQHRLLKRILSKYIKTCSSQRWTASLLSVIPINDLGLYN